LQHLPDLIEMAMGNVSFFTFPLFFRWKRDGPRRQREDLIKRRFVGDKRTSDQSLSGFTQGGQIDLQKGSDAIIMIKAQSVSIRDSDQKEIQKDLDHGQIVEESSRYESVVDPAEGAFDLSDTVGKKQSFDSHCSDILASMVPFSFGQSLLSNEFWISRQGRVEKRKVISKG